MDRGWIVGGSRGQAPVESRGGSWGQAPGDRGDRPQGGEGECSNVRVFECSNEVEEEVERRGGISPEAKLSCEAGASGVWTVDVRLRRRFRTGRGEAPGVATFCCYHAGRGGTPGTGKRRGAKRTRPLSVPAAPSPRGSVIKCCYPAGRGGTPGTENDSARPVRKRRRGAKRTRPLSTRR